MIDDERELQNKMETGGENMKNRNMVKKRIGIVLTAAALSVAVGSAVILASEEETQTSSIESETESVMSEKESESATSEMESETSETESLKFQEMSISAEQAEKLQYYLYIPEKQTNHMPLIVYLHGASAKGQELQLLTSTEEFPKYLQEGELGKIEAYVLMPQLPSEQKSWRNIDELLYNLIQDTVAEFSIDEKNISLTGFSIGGTGTWELAKKYPELFARIAPLSGSARGVLDSAEEMKDISAWVFVSDEDTVIRPNSSEDMVHQLKRAGAKATIHLFEGAEHEEVSSLVWLDEMIKLADWLTGEVSY